MKAVQGIPSNLSNSLENYKFRDALVSAMEIARIGNKYLADAEPWKLMKTDPEKAGTVLNYAVQLVAHAAVALEPFLPFTSQKLFKALGVGSLDWNTIGDFEVIASGQSLVNPGLLFEKIEDEVIQKQIVKLQETKKQMELANKKVPEIKETTSFDDFLKMDMRVGQIVAAEAVEKSKKLLRLTVDDGIRQRIILSGIAEHFTPEQVKGKQVTFLANLAPRKIMGVESEGMILMAEGQEGELVFLSPSAPIWNGAKIS